MLSSIARFTPNTYSSREPFLRLIDNLFANTEVANGEDIGNRSWLPPVDIQETQEAYRLYVDLPGLTKEDIQITLEHNVLRLSGERRLEKDVKKESFQRVERTYGTFARSFSLPNQVNAEGVEASFVNGVLTLTVPKAEQAKPRKIAIS